MLLHACNSLLSSCPMTSALAYGRIGLVVVLRGKCLLAALGTVAHRSSILIRFDIRIQLHSNCRAVLNSNKHKHSITSALYLHSTTTLLLQLDKPPSQFDSKMVSHEFQFRTHIKLHPGTHLWHHFNPLPLSDQCASVDNLLRSALRFLPILACF